MFRILAQLSIQLAIVYDSILYIKYSYILCSVTNTSTVSCTVRLSNYPGFMWLVLAALTGINKRLQNTNIPLDTIFLHPQHYGVPFVSKLNFCGSDLLPIDV